MVVVKYTEENCNYGFYKFPKPETHLYQRKKWIAAIKTNSDGSPWYPGPNDMICRSHFLHGRKSDNPRSIDYVPMIFPLNPTKKQVDEIIVPDDCLSHSFLNELLPTKVLTNAEPIKVIVNKNTMTLQAYDIGFTGMTETSSLTSIQENLGRSISKATTMDKGSSPRAHTATDYNSAKNQKDYFKKCRACLEKTDNKTTYNLYEAWFKPEALQGAVLADDLSTFADVEISESDEYSKVICVTCYRRLLDGCAFMIMVQKSDIKMRQQVNHNKSTSIAETSWPQPILLNKNTDGDPRIQVEIKQEVLSEDETDAHMDQDWEPTMDIKIEPEEMSAPVQFKALVNGDLDKTRDKTTNSNDSSRKHDLEDFLNNTIKEEPWSEDELLEAPPDLPLDCMLCFKVFNSVSGLKAHVISQHSYASVKRKAPGSPSPVKNKIQVKEYSCNSCDKSFTTSTDLMVHRASHSEHVCFVCDSKFASFQQLMRHGSRCQKKNAKTARRDHTRPPPRTQKTPQPTSICKVSQKRDKTEEINTKPIPSPPIEDMVVERERELVKAWSSDVKMDIQSSLMSEKELEIKKQVNFAKELNLEVTTDKSVETASENKLAAEITDEPTTIKIKIEPSAEETKEPLEEPKQIPLLPNVDIEISVQKQSENTLSEPGTEEIENRLPEHTTVDEIMEQVEKPQNESFNEEMTVQPVEGIKVKIEPEAELLSKDSTDLSQDPKSITGNNLSLIPSIVIASPESINNSLPKTNEDEILLSKKPSETIDEDSPVPGSPNQDKPEQILINITCENVEEPRKESNSLTEETEPLTRQEICIQNSSNEINDLPKEKPPTIDEISEMKVHLAINPLEKDAVLFETGMEDTESEKSGICEPKLVSVICDKSDIQQ